MAAALWAAVLLNLMAIAVMGLWVNELSRRNVLLKSVVQSILEGREPFQAVPPPRATYATTYTTTTATEVPAEPPKKKRTYRPRKPKQVELSEVINGSTAPQQPAEVAPAEVPS